jgi:hypothetical protein
MMKLYVEITPHEGDQVETEAVARLLTTMASKLWSEDFHLMQGPPSERTVILRTDVVDLRGDLVTALPAPDAALMQIAEKARSILYSKNLIHVADAVAALREVLGIADPGTE